MSDQRPAPPPQSGIVLRHAASHDDLSACFPVISQLRPNLKDAAEWGDRVSAMAGAGYRVLAAWDGGRVVAVAGYRVMENLIHGRFLYVDDLVTADGSRGHGLGASLLKELSMIGVNQNCRRLVLDTAAANTNARRFYAREGLLGVIVGFMKPLVEGA
jgi:ribosomal protein S18 acetylase RimI-like enzyme